MIDIDWDNPFIIILSVILSIIFILIAFVSLVSYLDMYVFNNYQVKAYIGNNLFF